MQPEVVIATDTQPALGWLEVAATWVGLEHMHLEDLYAVLLAEPQVGVQVQAGVQA